MSREAEFAARALAGAVLAALLLSAGAAPAEPVDLVGTWYVLVHYKDDNAPNPDEERWDDKVWVFERKGQRLAWTEYPIVVFDDESGRFERRETGQYARILHYWEPSPAQRSDIADGLQVNSRGSKQKTLRGSDADGWSSGRASAGISASVVSYQEVWSIEGLPSRPVFTRSDILGGGSAEGVEGITQYATTSVENGAPTGTFERDGTRHGTFRMLRSGEVGGLKGATTQEERQRRAAIRGLSEGAQSRTEVETQVREGLAEYGLFLSEADVKSLVSQGFELAIQGVPVAEIEKRLGTNLLDTFWSLAPRGATHDDATRYRFPFDPATPRKLFQGVGAEGRLGAESGSRFKEFEDAARHAGWSRFAFKFWLPVGTPVLAARGGEVVRVIDGFNPREFEIQGNLNSVWVLHDDGTVGVYMHLGSGIPLRPKDRVQAGDTLGTAATPGYVKQPLLHFAVIRIDAAGSPQTVDIRFDDGTAAGLVPVEGRSYPGG
jgi:murein DD-endopeptidase MepM/ murein hydrolase activator NlpD